MSPAAFTDLRDLPASVLRLETHKGIVHRGCYGYMGATEIWVSRRIPDGAVVMIPYRPEAESTAATEVDLQLDWHPKECQRIYY